MKWLPIEQLPSYPDESREFIVFHDDGDGAVYSVVCRDGDKWWVDWDHMTIDPSENHTHFIELVPPDKHDNS